MSTKPCCNSEHRLKDCLKRETLPARGTNALYIYFISFWHTIHIFCINKPYQQSESNHAYYVKQWPGTTETVIHILVQIFIFSTRQVKLSITFSGPHVGLLLPWTSRTTMCVKYSKKASFDLSIIYHLFHCTEPIMPGDISKLSSLLFTTMHLIIQPPSNNGRFPDKTLRASQ